MTSRQTPNAGRRASLVVAEEYELLSARLAEMKLRSYAGYLKTHHWRALREKWRKRACAMCGRKSRLHLHHLTYARLGRELRSDLMTLCWLCHNKVHRLARDGRGTLDPRVVVDRRGMIIEGRVKFEAFRPRTTRRRRRRRRRT